MRILAIVAMLGLSLVQSASSPVSAADKGSVAFSVFAITNTQSVKMKVTLEAPVGKVIYGPTEVAADGSVSIDPKVENVVSARVVVDYGNGPAGQTVTLGGEKGKIYIKTLMASGTPGNVRITDITGSNP